MTIKLTEKQIKDIAGDLETGMRCFYHKQTGTIKTVPNFDDSPGADEELWEEDLKELNDNRQVYTEIEGMTSTDFYKIMADFTDTVDNQTFQVQLTNALNRPKPFRNFKALIDDSSYREAWFAFKASRYIDWVNTQLDLINRRDFR